MQAGIGDHHPRRPPAQLAIWRSCGWVVAAQHPLKEFKETDLLVGRVSPLRAAVRQFVVERLGLKTLVWERTGDSARCGQRDVATFTGTQLTLGVIGMIATLVPALRVNPVVALRNE